METNTEIEAHEIKQNVFSEIIRKYRRIGKVEQSNDRTTKWFTIKIPEVNLVITWYLKHEED